MPIGAILGVAGAVIQGVSANNAARTQADAAREAAARQEAAAREAAAIQARAAAPWATSGAAAQNALAYEMGIGARPADYAGFTKTPAYDFQLEQGLGSVNALAGARGGLNSGRTMQDLAKFNQGLASQEYGGYLGRLQGMSSTGMGAATGAANAQAQGILGAANAQAEGITGASNARTAGAIGFGNALSGGINNVMGYDSYMKGMGQKGIFGSGNVFSGGKLFGGNAWG